METTNFSHYLNSLQERKRCLLDLAQLASDYGWIPRGKTTTEKKRGVISYDEIVEKLESDTLTIGVIGQMKCGKSTFLNAFIFENNILPAATTPMTAALSVITYGEKERIVAEFYTKDEWAEQKMQAARSLDDVADSLDESKVKAAKELVSKASKLGSSLESYLGGTKEDEFTNLIEYVGADGKYVSITKSVTIYYPKEYLKGVEIVDTPGFNDPIVSREERTKEFLKKADVVLMMLYAGRPFDATDRDIIFKNVRQCGIGKVLIGINKYDIPYCSEVNPEDENQIKDYVKAELKKACRDCNDNTLVEILNEVEPIPISAEMALLSELPMTKISNTEELNFSWNRHCKNFGISTQSEMKLWSHITILVNAVKKMLDDEKGKILFVKPLNSIIAAGNELKNENENELNLVQDRIKTLSMPDSERDDKEEKLRKINRKMSKRIEELGDYINSDLYNLVYKGGNEMEDALDKTIKKMINIVEQKWSIWRGNDILKPKLEAELQTLFGRSLKRISQDLSDKGKTLILRTIEDFFQDAEDKLMKYLPDFDLSHFIKGFKNSIQIQLKDNDLFAFDGFKDDSLWGGIVRFFSGEDESRRKFYLHLDSKKDALTSINNIKNDFDTTNYLQNIFHTKDAIIDEVKQKFITKLLAPLQNQIEEIRSGKLDKEKELEIAQSKCAELEKKMKEIASQIEKITQMKASLL
ncbi:MAG: dynamin family protein [Bacteroidaceae bacterium]|nr:dynamin family protein [Bacteroidaceae bacterium]